MSSVRVFTTEELEEKVRTELLQIGLSWKELLQKKKTADMTMTGLEWEVYDTVSTYMWLLGEDDV